MEDALVKAKLYYINAPAFWHYASLYARCNQVWIRNGFAPLGERD